MSRRIALALAFLLADLSFARPSADDRDPRIDAQGRELARYAPDSPWQFRHLRLELDIPDMSLAQLSAVETLRAVAVGDDAPEHPGRAALELDCKDGGPLVSRVALAGGRPLAFAQHDDTLRVTLPAAVRAGDEVTLQLAYTLAYADKKRGDGLTYSKAMPDNPSETLRAPQIHAQGQAELNRMWFPCHDSPDQRLTTELIVTVESGFEVLSNGRLLSKQPASPGAGGVPRTRWHWLQDKPHASYLVTVAIGKFAVVELGGPGSARPGLPMPVYVAKGREQVALEEFKRTPSMVAFFERVFGEPYPWDQYAQAMVRDFTAGGMENTSATLMSSRMVRDTPRDEDDTISHELAHQWTGDLVTCRTWAHIWLNEGFATFSEALWAEERARTAEHGDEDSAHKAYIRTLRRMLAGQRLSNRGRAPKATALVTTRYTDPDDLFTRAEDPYAKGALILHMLRCRLGDEAFFRGVRAYIHRFRFGQAETGDLRRTLEDASGQTLVGFFEQWVMRPGLPRVAIDYAWDAAAGTLRVKAEQTQAIDVRNPPYVFDLPLYAKLDDGTAQWLHLSVDGPTAAGEFRLSSPPKDVLIDPNLHVFAAYDVRTPLGSPRVGTPPPAPVGGSEAASPDKPSDGAGPDDPPPSGPSPEPKP